MENEKLLLTASAISVQQQSLAKNDVFLVVRLRVMDTLPNLNHQGCTQSFIDDMVSRRDQLIGLPLYCDVMRLLNHDYGHLGHMLDEDGVFHSTQIGSIIDFETINDGGVTALIATARIPKRQFAICECIKELYEKDALKFSFEISFNPQYTIEQNGVIYVDASPDNVWTGVAVVSVPAEVNSCALQMVAEKIAEADEGVENAMNEEQVKAMIAEAVKAKEEEMAKAIAEKDAVIAERDAAIAELNQAMAEKEQKAEEKTEQAVAAAEDAEKKDEACAESEEKKDEACAESEEKKLPWEKEQEATAEVEEKKDEACAEVDSLKAELATVKAELDKMKAEKMAAQMEQDRAAAKAFAEKQGLDSSDETVAKAIAELDYKMIAELTMQNEQHEQKKPSMVVASLGGDGFEIRGKWDDMLAPRK